jgi:hypothetical protein
MVEVDQTKLKVKDAASVREVHYAVCVCHEVVMNTVKWPRSVPLCGTVMIRWGHIMI